MAFDASQTNTPQPNQPVAGAAPLTTGTNQPSQQPMQVSPQPSQTAPQQLSRGGGIGSSGRRSPSQSAPQGPASSGSFTNIRNYMQRNQGAGEQIAGAVTQNVQQTADAVKQQKEKLTNQFQQAALSSGTQNVEGAQEDARRMAEIAAGRQPITPQTQQATTTPQPEANIPAQTEANTPVQQASPAQPETTAPVEPADPFAGIDQDRLSDIFNMRYQGPQDLREIGGFAGLQNEARRLNELRDTALSGDRRNVLKQTFGQQGQGYTAGLSKLDDLFLGGNINQLQQNIQGIDSGDALVQRGRDAARAIAQNRAGTIDTAREGSRSVFNEIAQARQGEIDQRLRETVADFDSLAPALKESLRAGVSGGNLNMGQAEAELLGIQNPAEFGNFLKNNPQFENLITANAADERRIITGSEFDQMAKLDALSRLAQGTPEDFGVRSRFVDKNLVESQTINDILNTDRFRQEISRSEGALQNALNQNLQYQGVDRLGFGYSSPTESVRNLMNREAVDEQIYAQNAVDRMREYGLLGPSSSVSTDTMEGLVREGRNINRAREKALSIAEQEGASNRLNIDDQMRSEALSNILNRRRTV